MRIFLSPLLLASALAAQASPQLDLVVHYAGSPGHARTQQWREFLAKHTVRVVVTDIEQFTEASAADADMVILDCPDPIVRNASGRAERIAVPRPKQLTASFGRPTIVVGGMAMITDRLQLKSNWL